MSRKRQTPTKHPEKKNQYELGHRNRNKKQGHMKVELVFRKSNQLGKSNSKD